MNFVDFKMESQNTWEDIVHQADERNFLWTLCSWRRSDCYPTIGPQESKVWGKVYPGL